MGEKEKPYKIDYVKLMWFIIFLLVLAVIVPLVSYIWYMDLASNCGENKAIIGGLSIFFLLEVACYHLIALAKDVSNGKW